VRRLGELVLTRDLAKLWKELASLAAKSGSDHKRAASLQDALQRVNAKLQGPGAAASPEVLQKSAYEHILAHVFQLEPLFPLSESRFLAMVEAARRELPALAYKVRDTARQILASREKLLASPKRYPDFQRDLDRLAPPDFLARTPPAQLQHLHRYLRAVEIRAERATVSPAKDAEKAKQLAPFADWENRVAPAQRESFPLAAGGVPRLAFCAGTRNRTTRLGRTAQGGWRLVEFRVSATAAARSGDVGSASEQRPTGVRSCTRRRVPVASSLRKVVSV
jgi:ATP-dependent helicase HrpA